jgi:hypothetical protein
MHCVSAMRVGNLTNQLATLMLFLFSASMSGCVGLVKANASNSAPASIMVSISPATAALQTSQTQQFTATVQNDSQNKGATWELTQSGNPCTPACGTVSETNPVRYSAPGNIPNPATVTLTAVSLADGTRSASSQITISSQPPPISVSVSPSSVPLQRSQTQQFTATVQNDSQNKGVTWELTQSGNPCTPSCGTLSGWTSENALYSAPATPPNSNVVMLAATSVADNSKTAAATILFSNAASSSEGAQVNVVDITSYGARWVPLPLSTTAGCLSGSNILNVTSADTFLVGDGISVYNCGPTITVTTPAAPAVSSGASASATMLDTPIAASTGGGKGFSYRIVTRDNEGGLTLPSPITTIANGSALGQQIIPVISAQTLGQQMTIKLVSNGPPNGSKVRLRGTSNSFFDTYGQVISGGGTSSIVLENLPFVSQATVTGGNLYYFNGNQLNWTNQSGAFEQIICASRPADSGTYHIVGIAPPNFTTFNDWGATITTAPSPLPPYVNDSVCAATNPTNDYLSNVTITGINANAVTMSANASQTTPNGTMNLDAAPALLAAQSALRSANGGIRASLYIPCFPVTSARGAFYLTSSVDLSAVGVFNGIQQCGAVSASETITLQGDWTGTTSDAAIGNGAGAVIGMGGAYPVLYGPVGLNVHNVQFIGGGNCLFIQDGYPNNGGGSDTTMDKLAFTCGGYAPITVLEANGFHHFFTDLYPNVGPGNSPSLMDTTWAASFYADGPGTVHISNQNQGFGGEFFAYNPTGLPRTLEFVSFYIQGPIMPSIATYSTSSSEYIISQSQVNDTSPMPYIEMDAGTGGGLYYVWLQNPAGNVPEPISGTSPVAFYPAAVELPPYTVPSSYVPDNTGNSKFELNSPQVGDNFNRGNGAVGSNWTVYQGGFNVVDNVAVGTGSVNNEALYTGLNGSPLPNTTGPNTSYGQGQWASVLITNAANLAGVIVSGGNGNDSAGGGINVPGNPIQGYGCFEIDASLGIYHAPAAGYYTSTAIPSEAVGDRVFCSVVPTPSGNIITAVVRSIDGTTTTLSYTDNRQTKIWGQPGIWTQGMIASVDDFTAGTIPAVASPLNENYWSQPQHFGDFIQLGPTSFSNLPAATGTVHNGSVSYCENCTITNPCAGGGKGAIAKLLDRVWVCN